MEVRGVASEPLVRIRLPDASAACSRLALALSRHPATPRSAAGSSRPRAAQRGPNASPAASAGRRAAAWASTNRLVFGGGQPGPSPLPLSPFSVTLASHVTCPVPGFPPAKMEGSFFLRRS